VSELIEAQIDGDDIHVDGKEIDDDAVRAVPAPLVVLQQPSLSLTLQT